LDADELALDDPRQIGLLRLCRSVKDFLWFFEFINEHGVEFVCLKQQYDTTTPHGSSSSPS
jgi:DNA invertase Pin-like site-specific DNA recombinase